MKMFSALVLAVFSLQASAASAISPSGKFFCRAETMIFCDGDGDCKKDESRIAALVDFDNNTVTSLTVENSRPKPLLRAEAKGNSIVASNEVGNEFTITEKPTSFGMTYSFKLVLSLGTGVMHFGSCNRA